MMSVKDMMAAPDFSMKEAILKDGSMKAVVRTDRLGEIEYISRSLRIIFGNFACDCHGQLIQDLIHDDIHQRNRVMKVLNMSLTLGQKCSFTQEVRDKDGKYMNFSLCTAPVFAKDRRVHHLLVLFSYNFTDMDENPEHILEYYCQDSAPHCAFPRAGRSTAASFVPHHQDPRSRGGASPLRALRPAISRRHSVGNPPGSSAAKRSELDLALWRRPSLPLLPAPPPPHAAIAGSAPAPWTAKFPPVPTPGPDRPGPSWRIDWGSLLPPSQSPCSHSGRTAASAASASAAEEGRGEERGRGRTALRSRQRGRRAARSASTPRGGPLLADAADQPAGRPVGRGRPGEERRFSTA